MRGDDLVRRLSTNQSYDQAHHFEERSADWSERYRTNPSFQARLAAVGQTIVRSLAPIPHARVLDYGGGTGVFSMLAAQHAKTVLCIDRSPAMLQSGVDHSEQIVSILADAGFDQPSVAVERLVGNDGSILPGDEPFDLVLAIAVLEYIDDCESLIRHLAGALRPGGLMLLTIPNPASPLRWLQRMSGPVTSWTGRWSGRMADQSFIGLRPHGDRVPWMDAVINARLRVESVTPLSLGLTGGRRMIHPSLIVSLRAPMDAT